MPGGTLSDIDKYMLAPVRTANKALIAAKLAWNAQQEYVTEKEAIGSFALTKGQLRNLRALKNTSPVETIIVNRTDAEIALLTHPSVVTPYTLLKDRLNRDIHTSSNGVVKPVAFIIYENQSLDAFVYKINPTTPRTIRLTSVTPNEAYRELKALFNKARAFIPNKWQAVRENDVYKIAYNVVSLTVAEGGDNASGYSYTVSIRTDVPPIRTNIFPNALYDAPHGFVPVYRNFNRGVHISIVQNDGNTLPATLEQVANIDDLTYNIKTDAGASVIPINKIVSSPSSSSLFVGLKCLLYSLHDHTYTPVTIEEIKMYKTERVDNIEVSYDNSIDNDTRNKNVPAVLLYKYPTTMYNALYKPHARNVAHSFIKYNAKELKEFFYPNGITQLATRLQELAVSMAAEDEKVNPLP